MYNTGTCKYNSMIDCKTADKCERCNWNPTYFEQLKEKNREKKSKFLTVLKAERENLTVQQYKTIKGQVLAGDIDGAIKGLEKCLRKSLSEYVIRRAIYD